MDDQNWMECEVNCKASLYGICAVVGCRSNRKEIKIWKSADCTTHVGFKHNVGACTCKPPVVFWTFPNEKKFMQERLQWKKLINRKNWKPTRFARVCSKHFKNGKPSFSCPYPIYNMGYDLKHVPKPRPRIKKHFKPLTENKLCDKSSKVPINLEHSYNTHLAEVNSMLNPTFILPMIQESTTTEEVKYNCSLLSEETVNIKKIKWKQAKSTDGNTMEFSDFRITGLACPPVTPFTIHDEIDHGTIKLLVQFMYQQGIKCLFVNGSTGESANLTQEERKLSAELWIEESKEFIDQVIIQVGAGNLKDTIELAKHAEANGADAIACVAPTYFSNIKIGDYVEYMRRVAKAAPKLPFYLYDIQFVTNIKVSGAEFFDAAVSKIPTLRGLKHTTPDFVSMNKIISKYEGKYNLILGTDENLMEGLVIGADTTICNSYMGLTFTRLVEAFKAGDLKAAKAEQVRGMQICDIRRKYGLDAVVGTRVILMALGISTGQPRLPLSKINSNIVKRVKADLESIGFFEWALNKNVLFLGF